MKLLKKLIDIDSGKIFRKKVLNYAIFFSMTDYKLAELLDWPIGPAIYLRSDSEPVQWLLDATWYNWSVEHRIQITEDVEACTYVRFTPTRLGARLQFPCRDDDRKVHANVFIQLYDHRVMTVDCFQLRTYKQWFAEFLRDI